MEKEYAQTALVCSVRARIVRELRRGRYRPGRALPTHRAWAKRFGVSTITVFRALEALKAGGFIDSSKGAATILRALPPLDFYGREGSPAIQPVRLTAWVYDRKDLMKINAAIVRRHFQTLFCREHPELEFCEKQVEAPSDEFQALLISGVLNSAEPTFAATTQTCLPFLQAYGALAPLAENGAHNAELEQYLAGMNPLFVSAGQSVQDPGTARPLLSRSQLMLPANVTYSFLFYNKALFSRAGLNPDQPPRDWEEFAVCAEKLSRSIGNKPSFHLAGFRSVLWWLEQLVYQTLGEALPATLPDIDWRGKAAETAVERLLDFYFTKRLLHIHTDNLAGVLPACLADEIPMLMDSGGFALQAAKMGDAKRFGIAPMPVGPNGREISQMNCGGYFLNAHAAPRERQAALRYLLAWEQWVHLGEGGRQLRAAGVTPGLFSLLRFPDRDQFLFRDLPADWQAALARIKAHGFWEHPGADWTKMTMGAVLADWLKPSQPPAGRSILRALGLNANATIIFKQSASAGLKLKDGLFQTRGLEQALGPGKACSA